MHTGSRDRTTSPQKRSRHAIACDNSQRGIATIWVIGFGPALLALLVLVTEIASLWLARIELETAAEAGALACVRAWGGQPGDTLIIRNAAATVGGSFAQANTVLGNTFTLAPNSVTFGSYVSGTITAGAPGTIPNGTRACVVQATAVVPGLWSGFGGSRSIQARASARYDTNLNAPRLVRVSTVVP